MIIQQGDVLLKEVQEIPNTLVKKNTNILHQGLNHTHIIKGEFELFEDNYLHAIGECVLDHDEHGKAEIRLRTLPVGWYKKSIVKEYDHFLEESKEVVD